MGAALALEPLAAGESAAAVGAETAATGAGETAAGTRAAGAGKGSTGSTSESLMGMAPTPGKAVGKVKSEFKPGGAFGGSKVLIAEFVACMVLVGVMPLIGQATDAVSWLKKGAAVTGLFFVLSLVASGGPRASKIAAAFGGLCTLALLINSRDVLNGLIALFGAAGGDEEAGPEDIDPGDLLGD